MRPAEKHLMMQPRQSRKPPGTSTSRTRRRHRSCIISQANPHTGQRTGLSVDSISTTSTPGASSTIPTLRFRAGLISCSQQGNGLNLVTRIPFILVVLPGRTAAHQREGGGRESSHRVEGAAPTGRLSLPRL